MSDKVKKGMIIAGCVVCCIVLVVMIASNFKGPAKTKISWQRASLQK